MTGRPWTPEPAPAVPYGIDEEAANRIALTVYDCKNGIKSEPLLHAINHILMKEIHPLSQEGLAQMQPTHQPVGNPDTLTPHEVFEQAMAALEVALRTQTERAESYAETLRSLASYVGAGGYNSDTVDAGVFEEKIRWGIGEIMKRMEKVEAEMAKARERLYPMWKGRNSYGLDMDYFRRKLEQVLRGLDRFTPDEFARAMATHSRTADAGVIAKEFAPSPRLLCRNFALLKPS